VTRIERQIRTIGRQSELMSRKFKQWLHHSDALVEQGVRPSCVGE
jgi:hypothetical protein